MLLAAGIGGLQSGTLPRVLGWAAVNLGIAFLTPAGIVAFLLTPLWIMAVSVVLYRSQAGQRVPEASASYATLGRTPG